MSSTALIDSLSSFEGTPGIGTWCCHLELSGEARPQSVAPVTGDQHLVRALIRLHGEPLGYVTIPLVGEDVDLDALLRIAWVRYRERINDHLLQEGLAAIDELTPYARPPSASETCPNRVVADELVSVVVCTRNRSEMLADCLSRLRMLTYPRVEVIVVDNAPEDGHNRRVVEDVSAIDQRFRYVMEPRPGLSCARNKGLAEALGTYVAYTDDDTSVDPGWVDGLVRGFHRRLDVACVTGLVCTASITNESEADIDARTPKWSTRMHAEVFDLRRARATSSVYPYGADAFGTGTNAAFDRAFLERLGGFDESLGPGTVTRGGEDLDIFVRTLFAAGTIAYEPSALVWHDRRVDRGALLNQVFERTAALSAIVTKYAVQRSTRWEVLRCVPSGLRAATRTGSDSGERLGDFIEPPPGTIRRRLAGWLAGPFLYARARRISNSRCWPESAANTAKARLVLSLLSLGSLATGAVAFAVGADAVRLASLMIFCLLGVGSAPWQTNTTLRLPARLALTMLTSWAVLTLVSMVMLSAHQWHPMIAFVAVAALCVPRHIAGVRLARRDAAPAGYSWRIGRLLRSPSILCASVGGALCLGSALGHRHIDPGFFGFLPKIGAAWFVGLALILVALALGRPEEEHEMVAAAVLLVAVLTLTPALVYDGPRSQVAAKHVDLVLQIQTAHRTDSALLIYNSWPGFFAATAWFCDITGIRDPTTLATYWPPLLGLLRVAALRYMFGQILSRPYQAWAAVALAVLADPIGADYFSPQSIGFVIGVVVFGLALSRSGDVPRLTMIFIAGWVLAVSHQLSPYTVGGVLIVLVVFRQVRPWWTPLLVLGPALVWAAVNRGALSGILSLNAIGRAHNFRPPKTVKTPGLERLPVVDQASKALTLGIVIIAVIALLALVIYRRRLRSWTLMCCPAVGLTLVAINPYGQEGIFRAALFAIPWLAVLAAHCFSPRGRLVGRLALLTVTAALAGTFLVAAFGLDAINVMRPSDLAAFRYFQHQGMDRARTPRYLLALGAGDLPTTLAPKDGRYQSVRRDRLGDPVRQEPVFQGDVEVERLTAELLQYSRQRPANANLYAVWTPVSSYHGWAYGLQSPDQFADLRDAFRGSPYWNVVLHQGDTYLFRFEPTKYKVGAP